MSSLLVKVVAEAKHYWPLVAALAVLASGVLLGGHLWRYTAVRVRYLRVLALLTVVFAALPVWIFLQIGEAVPTQRVAGTGRPKPSSMPNTTVPESSGVKSGAGMINKKAKRKQRPAKKTTAVKQHRRKAIPRAAVHRKKSRPQVQPRTVVQPVATTAPIRQVTLVPTAAPAPPPVRTTQPPVRTPYQPHLIRVRPISH